jgi:hypothetical protein
MARHVETLAAQATPPVAALPDRACAEAEATRFWSKVTKAAPSACWPWTGELNNHGYGRFRTWRGGRRRHLAHRIAYRLTVGPIEDGHVLLHSCDNPPCCNPAHLTAGTQRDNISDAHAKGRASQPPHGRGESASHVRLSEADVLDIRRRYAAGGITQEALGAEYGMPQASISCIIRGRSWSHLPLSGTSPDERAAMTGGDVR